MINLVFEDLTTHLNFISCKDINSSGIRRFGVSPLAMKMLRLAGSKALRYSKKPYIISASVNHSPQDWAKKGGCLKYLSQEHINDVRSRKAMIMLDQSLEGYQVDWLWEYLHDDCQQLSIPPEALIYVTGNMLAESQYDNWATQKDITAKINVISHPLFENDVYETAQEMNLAGNFQQVYDYKKNNLDKILTYSCLQKRLRNHRIWFYNHLYKANILEHGLVSMNRCPVVDVYLDGEVLNKQHIELANTTLPRLIYGKNNNNFDDIHYIRRITNDVFDDVWVSVISEALFSDYENSVFISEKTFKPIACMHPFIILGTRGSLKQLREMGYRTFEGFIDESYDDLSSFERIEAIINELNRIISIKDKLSWFESMRDILEHNYRTFVKNSTNIHNLFYKVELTYRKYFNHDSIYST